MTGVKTVIGAVRFLALFVVYVTALTAMGVIRVGRAASRRAVGLVSRSDPAPGRTSDVDVTGSSHPAADGDGIEESASP
ncbi:MULTISPECIES: hypothetical protein [unclassified Halorubrum]|uniref:hypothetical protein n=1 Tax=unclassified Halorubrum TaxID=2642239 RepID=UPI0012ABAB4E|nr:MULTISPECIES: hypothetical protein [unclassified Halorubrum]